MISVGYENIWHLRLLDEPAALKPSPWCGNLRPWLGSCKICRRYLHIFYFIANVIFDKINDISSFHQCKWEVQIPAWDIYMSTDALAPSIFWQALIAKLKSIRTTSFIFYFLKGREENITFSSDYNRPEQVPVSSPWTSQRNWLHVSHSKKKKKV